MKSQTDRVIHHDGHRMSVTLPTDTYACIQWLAMQRRFGTTPSDVASYLVMSGIERFMSLGILPPGVFGTAQSQDQEAMSAEQTAVDQMAIAAERRAEVRAKRRGRPAGSRNRPKG